jgi:hypothetical protein
MAIIASKWRSVVKLNGIAVEDIVEVLIGGRRLLGRVTEISEGVVYFNPICPGAGWRHAKARRGPHALAKSDAEAAAAKRRTRPTRLRRWPDSCRRRRTSG